MWRFGVLVLLLGWAYALGSMDCLSVPPRKLVVVDRSSTTNGLTNTNAKNSPAEGMDVEMSAAAPQDCRDCTSVSRGQVTRA
ncbi:hypothetical protein M0804_013170 [Polistes exclamans]|nr:hypothetical protein M0804_013170 [Polistes exclamans]